MPDECLEAGESVVVGKMNYDVILVPNCVTLRRSTICRLKAFKAKGGRVIFTGTRPSCIDAQEDREAELFAAECENVGFSRNQILTALEAHRIVDVCDQTGARVKNMLSQVRRDGSRLWLFLAHCYKMKNPDLPDACQITIKISGGCTTEAMMPCLVISRISRIHIKMGEHGLKRKFLIMIRFCSVLTPMEMRGLKNIKC